MQMGEARVAYETGGPQAVKEFLGRINKIFPNERFFTDSKGHDLVTGADRSGVDRALPESGTAGSANAFHGRPQRTGDVLSFQRRKVRHFSRDASAAGQQRRSLPYGSVRTGGGRRDLHRDGSVSGVATEETTAYGRPVRERRSFGARPYQAQRTSSGACRELSITWRIAFRRC